MNNQQTQIQQQANYWLEQQAQGMNAKQRDAFSKWLNTSKQHQDAYHQSQQVNELLTHLDETNLDTFTLTDNVKPLTTPKHRTIFTKLYPAAACIAVLMLAMLSYSYWPTTTNSQFQAHYQSARDQLIDFSLPDGSQISLDAKTQLAFNFNSQQRLSNLHQGRALFDIAKNPQRPFIINTERAKITVLGTRFSIDKKAKSTQVSVEHGRVKVQISQHSHHDIELIQGQQVTINAQGMNVQNINPQLVDAWRQGRLVFNNVPLGEVCAEFKRYHDTDFIFTDNDASKIKLSGTFTASELDNFLNLLPQVLPVTIKKINNHIVISKV